MCCRHVSSLLKGTKNIWVHLMIVFFIIETVISLWEEYGGKGIIKTWEGKVNLLPKTLAIHLNLGWFHIHLLVFATKYVQIIHWNVLIIWTNMKWLSIFNLKRKKNPQVLLSLLYYPVTLNYYSFKGLNFFLNSTLQMLV